jgi:tetratricopeptide (TPR) repeat protein
MARKNKTQQDAESRSPTESVAFDVKLDRLLGALPEQNDLAPLRQALLRASVIDATQAWSRSNVYSTFDKRVLRSDMLRAVVAEAARAEHARVDALYAAVGEVLEFAARGDDVAAGLRLLTIGEAAEAEDNHQTAMAYYEVAVQFSESVPDRRVRILALRRLARVHATLGEMEPAATYFRASLEQAASAHDIESQVVALTGLGNLLGFQGRWDDAIVEYERARALCGENYPQLRGRLANNLGAAYRERGEFDQASAHLATASALWSDISTADHSVWYNNRGLLALARGETDLAETLFRQALETASSEFDRAMVLDNLAELYAQQGNLSEAESFGRAAEEVALRAGSPRALAEIYTRLGKIFRLRSDLNGVTFFEKALEICRGRSYPLTEANAYFEYGIFRRILGDIEEARSFFERACELGSGIGATDLQRAANDQLAQA